MFREVWLKAGWIVFFVSPNCPVVEFSQIGIEHLGVLCRGKDFDPASLAHMVQEEEKRGRLAGRFGQGPALQFPTPQFPQFSGHTVLSNDSEPETDIIQRYIKNCQASVLSCMPSNRGYEASPYVGMFGEKQNLNHLICDTSNNGSIIAFKVKQSVYAGSDNRKDIFYNGAVLFLPDFGSNNARVALSLMQEVIPSVSPHLFDKPQHSWLEQYQPAIVLQLQEQKEQVLAQAKNEAEAIDKLAEESRIQFSWLPGLLVRLGDDFATDVAEALRYLGFDAEEVDNNVKPGDRKKRIFTSVIQRPLTSSLAKQRPLAKGVGRQRNSSQRRKLIKVATPASKSNRLHPRCFS